MFVAVRIHAWARIPPVHASVRVVRWISDYGADFLVAPRTNPAVLVDQLSWTTPRLVFKGPYVLW